MNAKDLKLSVADFDLIIDGLENLPNKNVAGEMMVDMLFMGLSKDNDDPTASIKRLEEVKKRDAKREMDRALLKEE